jgi:hypothetical protein
MPRAFYSSLIIFISIPNQRKMDIKLLSPLWSHEILPGIITQKPKGMC